jgi:hypothetical protein
MTAAYARSGVVAGEPPCPGGAPPHRRHAVRGEGGGPGATWRCMRCPFVRPARVAPARGWTTGAVGPRRRVEGGP